MGSSAAAEGRRSTATPLSGRPRLRSPASSWTIATWRSWATSTWRPSPGRRRASRARARRAPSRWRAPGHTSSRRRGAGTASMRTPRLCGAEVSLRRRLDATSVPACPHDLGPCVASTGVRRQPRCLGISRSHSRRRCRWKEAPCSPTTSRDRPLWLAIGAHHSVATLTTSQSGSSIRTTPMQESGSPYRASRRSAAGCRARRHRRWSTNMSLPGTENTLWLGHADMQTTMAYLRADPTEKLATVAAVVPMIGRRLRLRTADRLIASLRDDS